MGDYLVLNYMTDYTWPFLFLAGGGLVLSLYYTSKCTTSFCPKEVKDLTAESISNCLDATIVFAVATSEENGDNLCMTSRER